MRLELHGVHSRLPCPVHIRLHIVGEEAFPRTAATLADCFFVDQRGRLHHPYFVRQDMMMEEGHVRIALANHVEMQVVGVGEQKVSLIEFFNSASGREVHFCLAGCYGLIISLLKEFFLHFNSLNFIS